MYFLFDMSKVDYHAIVVEMLSSAVYGDNPVVAMEVFALASVG